MEDTVNVDSRPTDPAELRAGIRQILDEIDHLREQMARDQVEIERSRARTRATLDELAGWRK
jgi:hypothetical protein